MATKKATKSASTRTSAKKAAPKKATTTKVTTVRANKRSSSSALKSGATANIVIAEFIGTFILTIVALLSVQNVMPLFVGLTLALLVMSIGAISGSHVNPAVTFGLWAAKRLKSILLPFYWGAQFLGAMAAFIVISILSSSVTDFFAGKSLSLSFGHFGEFSWAIFMVEMIGTAVFLFGLTALTGRDDLTSGQKALGVGLSLFVGILVSMSLFTNVQNGIDKTKITVDIDKETGTQKLMNVPHELYVSGATLNPAVALAVTESTDGQLQGGAVGENETRYSRLSWEVILSTLLGAAVGSNLALLVGRRRA